MFGFKKFSFGTQKEGKYDERAKPSIYFDRPNDKDIDNLKKYLSSQSHPKFLYLLNPSYNFDFFKQAERNFSIISKNGIYKFNHDLLKETSITIKELLEHDPKVSEYQLHNEDNFNIMSKIEEMYLGNQITIINKEYSIFNQIIYELNIADHVSLNKQSFSFSSSRNTDETRKYQIKLDSFHSYLRNKFPQPFTIYTKNNEYKCNMTGIKSSNIINEYLINNPRIQEYRYEIDDEFKEFQIICDLFNFNFVKLTTDNMNNIKQICEDLEIDIFKEEVESFIEEYETRVQTIDDQQTLIESIEELFYSLYNIKEESISKVKNQIIESTWSQKEENVEEFVAFILQVIQTDISLQPYMIELIEDLSKNSNDTNKLNILFPFLKRKIIRLFGKNKEISSFIYKLQQKGIFEKEEIKEMLDKKVKTEKITESYLLFLPELYEILNKDLDKLLRLFNKPTNQFIQTYFPNNIERFIKMREQGEPEDEITKSLRSDDIDTFQRIISTNEIDIPSGNIPYNIFDNFPINNEMSYINYSATYGSLKCFKYLILNHAKIDDTTFSRAIFGGNIEIVKIVEQQKVEKQKVEKPNKRSGFTFSFKEESDRDNKINNTNINILFPAIRKHQHDLFDWLFENKFSDIIQSKELITKLLIESSKNCNSHVIISIIDRGFDFSVFEPITCHKIIKKSSKRGFYKLDKFLTIIMKKRLDEFETLTSIFDAETSVIFGNVSIFQLYYEEENKLDLKKAFSKSIEYENQNIVKYIFENFSNEIMQTKQNDDFIYEILSKSIDNKTTDIFKYLIEKIRKFESNSLSQNKLINLLSKACCLNKIEQIKTITDIILESNPNINPNPNNETIDFTLPFYNSTFSKERSAEMCQFFIDKKVYINFDLLSLQIQHLNGVNKEVFDIIIKNSTPSAKEIFKSFYLKEAINSKNKYLIEYLLKENDADEDCLFDAVKTGDIEIVNMILNKNSSSSFINQVSNSGTAINLAVKSNYYEIFKRLLSIPGIDLDLYDNNNRTPLINSILEFKLRMMTDILDYYDSENESFQKQLKEASEEFLTLFSNMNSEKKKNNEKNILTIYKKLIEYEFLDVNQYVECRSLFSFACEINQIEIVENLLKSKRVNINSRSTNGNTPLLIAINNRNIEIAKHLIKCDSIDINHRNNNKDTALTLSVDNRLIEIIDLIMNKEKFDPNKSRINYSFYCSNEEIAKKLIKCNYIDVNYKYNGKQDSNRSSLSSRRSNCFNREKSIYYLANTSELDVYQTPLYDATQRSLSEKVDLIINHPTFDPVKSLTKECIFVCCKNGYVDIFRKLIKIYNNDVNLFNSSNRSLFKISLNNDQINIIEEIINNENFDMKKSNFLSNFYSYLSYRYISLDIIQRIVEYDKNHGNLIDFQKLLPNGKSFFTTISYRTKISSQLVELFLSNGADPNIPDANKVYPLEYAIEINDIDYIKALIESNKIDFSVKLDSINSQNFLKRSYDQNNVDLSLLLEKKYTSYLHLALNLNSDDNEILSLLLKSNLIDINITDSSGDTPLIEACRIRNDYAINNLFEREELDYKHNNNNGHDALKISQQIFNNKETFSPNSKEEYLTCILKVINKLPSNNPVVLNNNGARANGFTFRFG